MPLFLMEKTFSKSLALLLYSVKSRDVLKCKDTVRSMSFSYSLKGSRAV